LTTTKYLQDTTMDYLVLSIFSLGF